MTSINDKLGLKKAGRRAMMELPHDRVKRIRLTAALCPACLRRGARLSRVHAGWFVCSWCAHAWEPAD